MRAYFVEVRTWGTGAGKGLGRFRVLVREDGVAAAVARSIKRTHGLDAWNFIGDGVSPDSRGRVEAWHYRSAVGRHLGRGRGMQVDGELWFAVDAEALRKPEEVES